MIRLLCSLSLILALVLPVDARGGRFFGGRGGCSGGGCSSGSCGAGGCASGNCGVSFSGVQGCVGGNCGTAYALPSFTQGFAAAPQPMPAYIRVVCPLDAVITINDQPTQSSGFYRLFTTTPITEQSWEQVKICSGTRCATYDLYVIPGQTATIIAFGTQPTQTSRASGCRCGDLCDCPDCLSGRCFATKTVVTSKAGGCKCGCSVTGICDYQQCEGTQLAAR